MRPMHRGVEEETRRLPRRALARAIAIAGGRRRAAVLAAVLLIALGLRAGFAFDPLTPQSPDARGYAQIAETLHRHGSFEQRGDFIPADVQPASNYSPGLPLFVAAVYATAGDADLRLARLVLAVIGSLSVLFAFLIGRRLAGPDAGLLAAVPVAIYPALLEYQGMLMTEPLAATLLSGGVLAFMRALSRPGVWAWALPGLLFGALAMVRPEYLVIGAAVPLIALLALRPVRGRRGAAAAAAVLAVAFLVPIVPWTVRNIVVLDRFVPISTGGGKVLFIGTDLASDGDPVRFKQDALAGDPQLRRSLAAAHPRRAPAASPRLLLSRLDPGGAEPRRLLSQRFDTADFISIESVLAALAERRHPGVAPDVALERMGRERLERLATEQPLDLLSLMAEKTFEGWRYGPRNIMETPAWATLHALVVIGGLLGLAVLAARRRPEALLFGLIVVGIVAMCALLIASPRRVVVAVPLLAALGGGAAVWARDALRGGRAAFPPDPALSSRRCRGWSSATGAPPCSSSPRSSWSASACERSG